MTRKQINRIRKIRTQAQVARHREKKIMEQTGLLQSTN
jgi:hypothetical protein